MASVILTNNDVEESATSQADEGTPDNADLAASPPTYNPYRIHDDDLAKITLDALPSWFQSGTVELQLSDPDAIRIFKDNGTLFYDYNTTGLTPLSYNVASPGNSYLPTIIGGGIPLWIEAVEHNSDFSFAFVIKDQSSNEIARDEVHMTLGAWDFINQNNEVNKPVTLTGLGNLLDAINDPTITTPPVAGAMTFKNRFQGFSDSLISEVKVYDPTNRADHFIDAVSGGQSTMWAAAYIPGYGGKVLTSSERVVLRNTFSLNAIAPPAAQGPRARVQFAQDVQQRNPKAKFNTWSTVNEAAGWMDGASKPTFEKNFRKWLGSEFGDGGGSANIRTEMWKLVPGKAPCSEVEQWPLLYFASHHGLPVQFVNKDDVLKKNHTINAGRAVSLIDVTANDADSILKQINRFGSIHPHNLLNLNYNEDTDQWKTVNPCYTSEAWTVSARTQDIPWKPNVQPMGQEMTDNAWNSVGSIQPGDLIITVNLPGWPEGDGQWQTHADFITDFIQVAAQPIDNQVYLMYNSSKDNMQPKIGEIIQPTDGTNRLNSHGKQYVIRSLNFTGFDQMWPA